MNKSTPSLVDNQKSPSKKKILKLSLLIILTISIAGAVYFLFKKEFMIPSRPPSPTTDLTVPTDAKEGITQKVLFGLWWTVTTSTKSSLPSVFAFSEEGVCTSWRGMTVEEFKCYKYEPYSVEENKLLKNGNYWMEWGIMGGKLELKPAYQDSPAKTYLKLSDAPPTAVNLIYTEIPTGTKLSPEKPMSATPAVIPKPPLPWDTYKNQEYGFRMSHPEEFFTKQIEDAPEYENRGYRFYTGPQGETTLKPFEVRHKNNMGIYIARRDDFPVYYSYSDLYSQLPGRANEFIFVGVYKDISAADLTLLIKNITCAFDPHYEMTLNFAGEVKIGKQGYQVKKFIGNSCVFGKNIKKDIDTVEAYIFEQSGYSYYIKLHRVNRSRLYAWASLVDPKVLSEILNTFELTERREPLPAPLKFVYPTGGEEWRMKQQTYTIRWTPEDFTWHDGYNLSRSRNGTVIFTIPVDINGVESSVAETTYDKGEFSWTIPLSGLVPLDRPVRLLMRIFPAGVSTTTYNPYFIYSGSFNIRPLITEYPPILFNYPKGSETIKLGFPIQIAWNVLPNEITKMGLSVKRIDPVSGDETGYGSILPTKLTDGIYDSTGWTPGMTSYSWDTKTIYIGLDKKTISPGKYKIILWFTMPDNHHTQIESEEFTITSL